jgi:quercetin dioxygenase-like cupin family protein
MPHIEASNAPTFNLPGLTVIALAAPSRGATTTCAWRVTLAPRAKGVEHVLDKEEIFVALSGRAVATIAGARHKIRGGDALVVPAGQAFSLANEGVAPFEAVALAPVGIRATLPQGTPFPPPWTE